LALSNRTAPQRPAGRPAAARQGPKKPRPKASSEKPAPPLSKAEEPASRSGRARSSRADASRPAPNLPGAPRFIPAGQPLPKTAAFANEIQPRTLAKVSEVEKKSKDRPDGPD